MHIGSHPTAAAVRSSAQGRGPLSAVTAVFDYSLLDEGGFLHHLREANTGSEYLRESI